MAIRLFSAFSTLDIGQLRGTARSGSSGTTYSWTIDGNFFLPFGAIGFATGSFQYSGAVNRLTDTLTSTMSPSGVIFNVRYDNVQNRCILSASETMNLMTFNSASSRVFGFDLSYTNQKIVTGSRAPWFVWTATQGQRRRDSFPYEESSYIEERLADSGRAYSVGRVDIEQRRDWEFALEPKSNVFSQFSSSVEPFGWQRFINNLREGPTPFVLMEDVTGSSVSWEDREAMYEMTAQGALFAPKSEGETDYHEYWKIPVRTRLHFPKHKDLLENKPGLPPVFPDLPTVIYPTNGTSSIPVGTVVLSWSQAANADFYNVYLGTDDTPDIGELIKITSQNFFSASVVSGTITHYWRVDPWNDNGLRTNDVWSFTTAYDASAPSQLLNLSGVLALWIAGQGVTQSGGRVVRWADQSGNGFDLISDTTRGPTLVSSDSRYNGAPSINFVPTSPQFMSCSYIPTKGTVSATGNQSGVTIVAIWSPQISGGGPRFVINWGSADDNSAHLRTDNATQIMEAIYSLSGTYQGREMDAGESYPITASVIHTSLIPKDATGYIELKQNGVYGSTAIAAGALANKTNEGPFYVGTNTVLASANSLSGSITELVILNNPMTSASLQTILQYAQTRYGITSGVL